MLEISMSGLERAIECTASLVLQQSPTQGAWASYGHVVHAFLQRVPTMGREAALAAAPKEHQEALESIDVDAMQTLNADGFAYEVAIALDLDRMTARELGRGISRDEAYRLKRPGELVGTLDVLGTTSDAVIVIDYKSGFRDLGPVRENWQLRGYALLAATLYGKRKAVVGIIRPGALEPYFDSAELGDIDLDVVEDALTELRTRYGHMASHSEPTRLPTRQGRWCTFCPAFPFCPAKRALVTMGFHAASPMIDEESAAMALSNLELLEEATRKVRAALEEYAVAHPVPLPNGWVYGVKVTARKSIDVPKARNILEAELGPEVRAAIVAEERLSQADLKRLVMKRVRDMPKGERPAVSTEVRRILDRLEQARALEVKKVQTVTRHKPSPWAIPAETEGEAGEAAPE